MAGLLSSFRLWYEQTDMHPLEGRDNRQSGLPYSKAGIRGIGGAGAIPSGYDGHEHGGDGSGDRTVGQPR